MRTTIVARDSSAAGSAAMRWLTAALTVLAFGCMEARAGAVVFWTDQQTGTIGRANPDGSGVTESLITGAAAPAGMAADGQYLYWANASTSSIARANLDGTGVDLSFITGANSPVGVAVDGQHVYWANQGSSAIGRAGLDGTGVDQAFIAGTNNSYGVAVDASHVYWTNANSGTIGRANLDGTGIDEGFITGANNPLGIAVDDQHVYWTNNNTGFIGRANLDGTSPDQQFVSAQGSPFGLTVDAQAIYWADRTGNRIGKATLDGATITHDFVTGAFSPVGVASVLPPALGPPSVMISSPGNGATYALGAAVTAAYACTPGANGGTLKAGTAGCSGPVATGAAIDTSTLGVHAFTVTATDTDGQSAAATSTYTVTAPLTSGPIVTDIRPVGPILAGRLSTISVQTAGTVASLRWNLSGDSRPEVSCDGRQTELTFRAPAQGTDAISVTAVTAAGATGVASAQLNVSAAAAIVGRTAAARRVQSIVSQTIRQAPSSYACTPAPGVHFDYVNSITLHSRACIAPSTIHVAGLELSGCLRPLTAPSEVPPGEQAILERLAPNSDRIQLHQNLQHPGGLSMALLLGNAYRSDGPVRVNGVDMIPHNGSAVLVLPLVRQLGGSNVGLAAGGLDLKPPQPGLIMDLGARLGSDVPLGQFQRLELPDALKTIGSFGLIDDVDVTLVPGDATTPAGAKITVHLKVPDFLTFAGTSLKGTVTLLLTSDGTLIIDDFTIGPFSADLGGLGLSGLTLKYTRANDEWLGQGKVCIPGGGCLDMTGSNGGLLIQHGKFGGLSISYDLDPPGIPLYAGVFLTRIGLGFGVNPTRLLGGVGVTIVSLVTIDGKTALAFPTTAAPFTLRHFEVGDAFPSDFYSRQYTTFTVAVGGDASVAVPYAGTVRLGGGYLLYEFPGYAAFGGNLADQNFFDVLTLHGGVNGEVNFETLRFNMGGDLEACVVGVCAGSVANISSRGVGGCIDVFGLNIGGGVVFHPLTLELWPFDGCKWSRFAETGIFAQATHTARAVTAASGSTVVRIAKGDRSRAIRLDGATGAPRVHVSGPGGVNLDSPVATGLARQPQTRIMRSEPLRATVVGLVNPVPGQYTITPDPGSATVTRVTEAQDQPDAKVTATVKGRGAKRSLVYDIARRHDQRVTFIEVDHRVSRELGTVGSGRGRLVFTPAPGRGARTIVARFELAGLPAERMTVARFTPPPPTIGRPAHVHARLRGRRLLVNWTRVPDATRYDVILSSGAGTERLVHTRVPHLTTGVVDRVSGGVVSVRATAANRIGRPSSSRWHGVGSRRFPRITPLRRPAR